MSYSLSFLANPTRQPDTPSSWCPLCGGLSKFEDVSRCNAGAGVSISTPSFGSCAMAKIGKLIADLEEVVRVCAKALAEKLATQVLHTQTGEAESQSIHCSRNVLLR